MKAYSKYRPIQQPRFYRLHARQIRTYRDRTSIMIRPDGTTRTYTDPSQKDLAS